MCQRKPGPRCSADATKTLTRLTDTAESFREKYLDNPVADDPQDYNKEYTHILYNVEKAKYNVSATPEGISALKENIANDAAENVLVPLEKYQSLIEGGLNIRSADLLQTRLDASVDHREWQKETVLRLAGMDDVESKVYVDFVSSNLRENIQNDKVKLSELENTKKTMFSLPQGEIIGHARKLRTLEMRLHTLRHQVAYNQIKLEDLSSL
jgi:hypothetical protein